jgi:hypothetical protein
LLRSARSGSFLIGLAALLAACETHPAGIIVVPDTGPPGLPILYEVEPNDEAWYANEVGPIIVGEHFLIEGHITECCPDPYDGFSFQALEPMEVELTLHAYDPAADLDFCIYDPQEDAMIACFEGTTNPEFGSLALALPAEFHVVVSSWFGDSPYTLEVRTFPLIYGFEHDEDATVLAAGDSSFRSLPAALDGETRQRFEAYRAPRLDPEKDVLERHAPVPLRRFSAPSTPTGR